MTYTNAEKPTKGWIGYFATKAYFSDQPGGEDLVKGFAPSKLKIVPDIYIRIPKSDPANITIVRVYPDQQEIEYIAANQRAVCALRSLWSAPRRGWERAKEGGTIVFHYPGRIQRDWAKVVRPTSPVDEEA